MLLLPSHKNDKPANEHASADNKLRLAQSYHLEAVVKGETYHTICSIRHNHHLVAARRRCLQASAQPQQRFSHTPRWLLHCAAIGAPLTQASVAGAGAAASQHCSVGG
jgi:hypothetical protein